MDSYTSECFRGLKSKIYTKYSFDGSFDEFDMFYPFTNEYVCEYIKYANLENKKNALSVMASGDQVFNLIIEGIMDIDTFDVNKITEYYVLGLKRTMIMKYSYQEFLDFFTKMATQINQSKFCSYDISDDVIKQLVLDLESDMDKKYRDFWLRLIDEKSDRYFSGLLMYPIYLSDIRRSRYLDDEGIYNLLKSKIGQANISFVNSNVSKIDEVFKGKRYDVVMLSNVLDYMSSSYGYDWGPEFFNKFEKTIEPLCEDDSTLFLHYLMSWRYDALINHYGRAFLGSTVRKHHLDQYRIIPIETLGNTEGIVLKKVFRN